MAIGPPAGERGAGCVAQCQAEIHPRSHSFSVLDGRGRAPKVRGRRLSPLTYR